MTLHALTRSWRVARVATAALALTAGALTVSGAAAVHSAPLVAPGAAAPVAATCSAGVSAQRVRADSSAGTVDPNDLTLAQTQQAESKLAARARQRGFATGRTSLPKVKINVYVHVIETDAGKGGVSKSKIKKQISVLNKAYGGKSSSSSTKTGFSFKLKATDKTKNSEWYDWASPEVDTSDDVAAKTALHRGTFKDLNLYVTSLSDGLLGYATFPFDTTVARDGVVVLNSSLPGGSATDYNKGDTATHEVGHWLGLLHTFENGCASPGDEVGDTPYQADGPYKFTCDTKHDTCASAGKDPVHNFMSYGDDNCLNRFTKGQAARMHDMWTLYRVAGAAA